MADAATLILVLITSGDMHLQVTAAAQTTETLSGSKVRTVEVHSEEEGAKVSASARGMSQVIVRWQSADDAQIEVTSGGSAQHQWIHFSSADGAEQRGRAVGLTIASMLPAPSRRGDTESAPTPVMQPSEAKVPFVTQVPIAKSETESRPRFLTAAEFVWGADTTLVLVGAGARAQWRAVSGLYLGGSAFFRLGGVGAGVDAVRLFGAHATVSASYRWIVAEVVEVGPLLELSANYLQFSRGQYEGGRWISGQRTFLSGSLRGTVRPTLSIGVEWLWGDTNIQRGSAQRSAVGPLRVAGSLGVELAFQ
jgi:hypothetical protein